jgi:hypothetical protein
MAKKSKIIAHCPWSVELSKRATQNSLKIDVELEGKKVGSLHIARGSVEWWPDYKKVNAHRFNWWQFVDLLETKPERRSQR